MVCVRARCDSAWRAWSWDRFMVPLPFSRVELRYAVVDPDGGDLDALTRRVESALDVDSTS